MMTHLVVMLKSLAESLPSQVLFWDALCFFGASLLYIGLSFAFKFLELEISDRFHRGAGIILEKCDRLEVAIINRLALPVIRHNRTWLIIILSAIAVGLIGAYAPPILALPILVAGLVWLFFLYRLWSSDEEDRAHGVMPNNRRMQLPIGQDVTSIIWIIVPLTIFIFPLIFYQFDLISHQRAFVGENAGDRSSIYIRYFFAELQKLIPLIKEGELIHAQLFADVRAVPVWGVVVTFIFRVLGDLLILSVALKLIDVLLRVARGLDLRRQEEKLQSADIGKRREGVADLKAFAIRRSQLGAIEYLTKLVDKSNMNEQPYAVRAAAAWALLEASEYFPIAALQMLRSAEQGYLGVISAVEPGNLIDQANALNELGIVLLRLGQILGGAECISTLRRSEQAILKSVEIRAEHDTRINWAQSQNNLTNTYRALSEHLNDRAAILILKAAEQACHSALTVRTKDEYPREWANQTYDLACVLLRKGERQTSSPEKVATFRAAEGYLYEVLSFQEHFKQIEPMLWANSQNMLGNVLWRLSPYLPVETRREALPQAGIHYRNAIAEAKRSGQRMLEASWCMNLGNVLRDVAKLLPEDEARRSLAESLHVFDDALEIQTAERLPMFWAYTQHNRATTLIDIGRCARQSEQADAFRRAVMGFENSLTIRTEGDLPAEWARSKEGLGRALELLGGQLDGDEGVHTLQLAIAAQRDALRVATAEELLNDCISIRCNLAGALAVMSNKSDGAGAVEALHEAVQVLRGALTLQAEDQSPTDWIFIQTQLGEKGTALASRLGGKEAIEIFESSLFTLRTAIQSAVDHDYIDLLSEAQTKLASALVAFSECPDVGPFELLTEAEEACRAALSSREKESQWGKWAETQNIFCQVLGGLALKSAPEDASAYFEDAQEAYRSLLVIKTAEDAPFERAVIQYNFGNVLQKYAEIAPESDRYELHVRAVSMYKSALEYLTKTNYFNIWAQATTNMGIGLRSLCLIADNAPRKWSLLEESRDAFMAVTDGLTESAWPRYWSTVHLQLSQTLAMMGAQIGNRDGLPFAEEAISAARTAMTENTRDNFPAIYDAAANGLKMLEQLRDALRRTW